MSDKQKHAEKQKEKSEKERRCVLPAIIDEDQRRYVDGIREWLRDSLEKKGKIVGGPI